MVSVAPGRRDLVNFLQPNRREQIGALLSNLVGRPVRVELHATVREPAEMTDAAAAAPGRPDAASGEQRRAALGLPLVKSVLDLFDASLVSVRKEDQPDPRSAPPASPGPDSEASPQDEFDDSAYDPE